MPPRDPPRPRPPPQWRPHQAPPTNSASSPVNGHAAGDAPAGAAAAFTAAAAEELAPVERAPSRADAGGRRFPRSDRPARCRPRRGGPADLADAAGPPQMRGGDGNHGGQAGDLRPVAELRAFHEGRGVRGGPAAGTSGGRGNTLHAPSYLHAWWVAKHQPLASRGGCHMYPRARHSGHPPGRSCGGSRPRRQAREGGASKTACRARRQTARPPQRAERETQERHVPLHNASSVATRMPITQPGEGPPRGQTPRHAKRRQRRGCGGWPPRQIGPSRRRKRGVRARRARPE